MSSTLRKDPPISPPEQTCKSLFVGGLPRHLSPTALYRNLHSIFENTIGFESISVQSDCSSKPLGHAYVNFKMPENAENALKSFKFKITIAGKQCNLMPKKEEVEFSSQYTVYVKNLHISVTDEALYNHFSPFEIVNCKISRNEQTNKPLGYGYISFKNKTSSQKAIQQMNGTEFHNKILKVEQFIPKSQRESMPQYSKSFTNVYVKNIPLRMTEQRLIDMFEQQTNSKITSSFVSHNKAASLQRFALLNFDTTQHAMDAIQQFDGKMFDGHPLYVRRAQSRKERDFKLAQTHKANSQMKSKTNLKIKNLAPTVHDRQLFQKFKSFGWIKRYSVHATFGFVEFLSPHDAQKAMFTLNNSKFHGRRILVSFAADPKVRTHVRRNMYSNMRRSRVNNINNAFVSHMHFQQQFEQNSINNEMKHEQNNLHSLSILAKKRLLQKGLLSKLKDFKFTQVCANEVVDELLKLDDEILVNLMQNDVELWRKVIDIESELKQNGVKDELNINNEIEREEKRVEIECKEEEKEDKEINKLDGINEVEEWLTNIVLLPQYRKHFISEGFEDLETIKTMNEDDLKEIGIKILGHRRKFLMCIKKLKTSKNNYPDEGINHN